MPETRLQPGDHGYLSDEDCLMARLSSLRSRVKDGEEELRPLMELTVQTIQGAYSSKLGPWVARQQLTPETAARIEHWNKGDING